MQRRTRNALVVGAAIAGAIGVGTAVVGATGDDDDDETDIAISGDALTSASAAALEHLGEGRVTGTEVGDEESYYEVEVTLEDGRQVDVQLDEQFDVVGSAADDEDGGEDAD